MKYPKRVREATEYFLGDFGLGMRPEFDADLESSLHPSLNYAITTLVASAYFLRYLALPRYDVREWKWPLEELHAEGRPFSACSEPWGVMFREAVRLRRLL